jgi:predicted MFS family arabinose efflux permease
VNSQESQATTRASGDQHHAATVPGTGLHPALVAMFAAACGLAVANIYYAQPLIALIAPDLGLHAGLAGLIVALTQLGYAAGLLFVVPLSDRFENRRLIAVALGGVVAGLIGVALSDSMLTFLAASFVVGVGAVATQVLVPFASYLAPAESRGRVVGIVMGGLLSGIMLARPFSSYVAAALGWRAVFLISAVVMLMLIAVLLRVLPQRRPIAHLDYRSIMRSLPGLIVGTPALRRRAFYQGMLFAAFNVFWTGSPLLLVREFGIGHRGIALFTLAGAAGALAAPIAGRLADRGLTRTATGFALAATVLAFVIGAASERTHSLALLIAAALLLDAAVQVNQVLSLRCIYMLAPEQRGRLNGLFLTFVFLCGAVGSVSAAALYVSGGWIALAAIGGVFGMAALAFYATEFRGSAPRTALVTDGRR